MTENQKEYLEERIAIMMHDGGLSEAQAKIEAYKLMCERFKISPLANCES